MIEPVTFAAGVLAAGGVATHATRSTVLRARWRTWLLAAPITLVPLLYLGRPGAVLLAAGLGVIAAVELGSLARLTRTDVVLLAATVAATPLLGSVAATESTAAVVPESSVAWLLLPVLAALPALRDGDTGEGFRRTCVIVFGAVWLGGGLVPLVLLAPRTAVAVCLGVAVADVGAWCFGKALRGPALSAHSPNKTWAGVLGSVAGAALVLWLLGSLSVALLLAVAAGSVVGDLLESMVKRGCGRKDAGSWLPGFGGLLDRIDSLLVALPLALVLS
jgi:phosphatidate cytidylyltransferase